MASGRTRRVRGNNLVPIEFQIDLEFPDKYLRRDESPAEETDPTSTGFSGSDLIQLPVASVAPPRAGGAAPTPAQLEAQRNARLNTVKQDFVRFALGIFADTFATFPLTFSFAAQAEAPQGKADVLNVTRRGRTDAAVLHQQRDEAARHDQLELAADERHRDDTGTASAPDRCGRRRRRRRPCRATRHGDRGRESSTRQGTFRRIRQKAQATPVDNRIYYADYREVDGVRLPFRLRRSIGTDTTEETTFDRFRLNVAIPAQRFAVQK